jgi:hypothetical protein
MSCVAGFLGGMDSLDVLFRLGGRLQLDDVVIVRLRH